MVEEPTPKTRSIVLDPVLAAVIADTARDRGISEAAVIRDWLRRGQRDYERERKLVNQVLGKESVA